MSAERAPGFTTYAGLFLVTLATVMYEIVLTRIFSVTMWYHFAFVAISVAMFGMTVGAVLVYLKRELFTSARVIRHLGFSTLLFAISVIVSFLIQLQHPFGDLSLFGVIATAVTYLVIAVPFVFSGICVCLALTRFPRHVSRMYAVDLAGAAVGCLLVILTLDLTDGPTSVIAIGAIASLAAVLFVAFDGGWLRWTAIGTSAVLVVVAVWHTVLVREQTPFIRVQWVKGRMEPPPLYEKWNSFSRIAVFGDPRQTYWPVGWGLSPTYRVQRGVRQLTLQIDATAGTVLTAFDGGLRDLEHLKYDVTNVAHYIRRPGRVLIVGVGGGRDILAALLFGQESIVGVEINQDIVDTVNRRFGEFTGHLDRHPRLRFVTDEARSYVARQKDHFDIVQISLIDTYAATAAGAYVLTENALYTVEAWKLFLERLTPNGVLAVSRYHFLHRPDEMYRLTSLARAALTRVGVQDPRPHIMIVKQKAHPLDRVTPVSVATILVSRAPFSNRDIDTVEGFARTMQFEMALSPRFALDDTFATLASRADPAPFLARFPVNIEAPTDERPFFFHTLRLRDVFDRSIWQQEFNYINLKAVSVLGGLLVAVFALTILCIIVPLVLTTDRTVLRGSFGLFTFFASIGLGFMLVEISQMQRLIVFLGHPTYSLTVVLFSLLLSSGLGSYMTERWRGKDSLGSAAWPLGFLLGALVIFGALTPYAIRGFEASTTPWRITVAVVILLPLGFFMGMAFPLGMRIAAKKTAALTAWLWGVNGATSVCASVLAVVIAMSAGISATFWTGVACYAVASAAYLRAGATKVAR